MKRVLIFTASLFILASSVFAKNSYNPNGNPLTNRFFDITVDAPVQFSNNYFSIKDLFISNGEPVVIDFRDMAETLPDSGFRAIASATPSAAVNINTKGFGISFETGAELYTNIGIGKDLIDFLGYGNELYEDITASTDMCVDIFTYFKIPVRVTKEKVNFNIAPSFFLPLVHVASNDAKAVIKNSPDGKFNFDVYGRTNMYSLLRSDEFFVDGQFIFDPAMITTSLSQAFKSKNFGFDIEGSIDWKYSKALTVSAGYRIPILPGHLNNVAPMNYLMSYEVSISELSNGAKPESEYGIGESKSCDYVINRPLKLNASFAFDPFHNDCFVLSGMAGFGVRHPFASDISEVKFFPEYNFAVKLSLAGVLTNTYSTSYIDQLFIHQAALGLNLRVIEIDVGASLQSSTFASSFSMTGFGAFATVSIGF